MSRFCLNTEITHEDSFYDMGYQTMWLYLELNASADDYGFVDNVNSVIRQTGCNSSHLETLTTKGYVYRWSDGVLVIMDWFRHNNKDKSKNPKTKYQDHLAELGGGKVPGDGKTGERYYLKSDRPEHREPNREPQDNITKSNLISNTSRNGVINIPVSNISVGDRYAGFDYLFADYPNRERLQQAEQVFKSKIDEGADIDQIETALNYYLQSNPAKISTIESFLYAWDWYYKQSQKVQDKEF